MTCSILCSYEDLGETSLPSCDHTCTHLGIPIAGEVKEKEEWKKHVKGDKFSYHIMVDREIFTYRENKKILILNKKFKIFDFKWNNAQCYS